ncbi:right-handed parallel beta-helix repeat-containing protein [Pseudogracilibacillus sp. SO30301A]|uniref:right-handed parallel beta-helix repeat-containing protein n=1 Tax=Pseudogracilibacillus sp. SO30301A TaxID=3098291 RepID=UPI00300E503D
MYIRGVPIILCYSLLLFFVFPISFKAEATTIQQQINEANPGDKIQLDAGIYIENITIDKPIHLIGEKGVIIQNNSQQPIISIQASNIVLENITLQYQTIENDSPAILIQGTDSALKNLQIDTNSYGIRLDQADNNELSEITINGKKEIPLPNRQHGIDVWKSDNNSIHNTHITDVQDGIYIESSNQTSIYNNYVSHSRYGYHLMFTENTSLEQNESYENISGMMVMGTNGTKVNSNIIKYNQTNVQSLGLYLFDVNNATITQNEIAHNRIGIFIEDSNHNYLSSNNIQSNFIGIQFKRAENNTITRNAFTANVVQGQAEESANNNTNQNYWGDHFGLDATGDKISNLTYEIDPFYLHLTNEYPPYRLLFYSPGMLFLEQLLHTPVDERLVDLSPLMENPLAVASTGTGNQEAVLLCSSILLGMSITIILMGARKQ